MIETTIPNAVIRLRGHEPGQGWIDARRRSTRTRATRALLFLLGLWLLAPLVFVIPPHYPWTLAAFVFGIYFAHKHWTGEYEVRAFRGACPRCGSPLKIDPGTLIRRPHSMSCYGCHHHPEVEFDPAGT